VTLTREAFPRLAITRGQPAADAVALGPLVRSDAEAVVELLEELFPLRPCRPRLRRAQDNPACVLKDLHQCAAPCDGTQTPDAYAQVVTTVAAALDRPDLVLPEAHARMTDRSAKGSFELAARQRDRLHALVRGYEASRRHALLADVSAVLARDDAGAVELVAIRRGRLHATWRTRPHEREDRARALIADLDHALATPSPPADDGLDRAEALLLERWWQQPQVVVLYVVGTFASTVTGSSALTAAGVQLREVERAMRGDEVVLGRSKVRRRS
jgi:DNA polymerase-3 subunit epsilon